MDFEPAKTEMTVPAVLTPVSASVALIIKPSSLIEQWNGNNWSIIIHLLISLNYSTSTIIIWHIPFDLESNPSSQTNLQLINHNFNDFDVMNGCNKIQNKIWNYCKHTINLIAIKRICLRNQNSHRRGWKLFLQKIEISASFRFYFPTRQRAPNVQ